MKKQKQQKVDESIIPTIYKDLSEKEYKAHLKELGIDTDTIKVLWEKIERGRK